MLDFGSTRFAPLSNLYLRHWGRDKMTNISTFSSPLILKKYECLTFVPKGQISNIPTLVQRMAWRRANDKPLYEPMMASLLTQACIIRPQSINWYRAFITLIEPMWCTLSCLGSILINVRRFFFILLPMFFRVAASLAPRQSRHCPSASEVMLPIWVE